MDEKGKTSNNIRCTREKNEVWSPSKTVFGQILSCILHFVQRVLVFYVIATVLSDSWSYMCALVFKNLFKDLCTVDFVLTEICIILPETSLHGVTKTFSIFHLVLLFFY